MRVKEGEIGNVQYTDERTQSETIANSVPSVKRMVRTGLDEDF